MTTAAGKKAVARRAADALALECARATALDKLRKRLNAAGVAAGAGAPPPQAFERWRFAAKHAEETDPGVTVPADARDPSVPSVVDADDGAPVAQLESDLARAGVPAGTPPASLARSPRPPPPRRSPSASSATDSAAPPPPTPRPSPSP